MSEPSPHLSAGGSININSNNTSNSYNTVVSSSDLDSALDRAKELVLEHGSAEDGMLFQDLSTELAKQSPSPQKAVAAWSKLKENLPALVNITKLADYITKIPA